VSALTPISIMQLPLVSLLDWLDRESLAAQRRITVPFLRQVVEEGSHRL